MNKSLDVLTILDNTFLSMEKTLTLMGYDVGVVVGFHVDDFRLYFKDKYYYPYDNIVECIDGVFVFNAHRFNLGDELNGYLENQVKSIRYVSSILYGSSEWTWVTYPLQTSLSSSVWFTK